jgi:hypothetical protein
MLCWGVCIFFFLKCVGFDEPWCMHMQGFSELVIWWVTLLYMIILTLLRN